MAPYTYLLVNLLSVAIPFAYSFHPRLGFHRKWPAFWPACLVTAAVFLAWDVLYAHIGVWGFTDRYLIGIRILGLPLEEWLFFICIPYACVFTYACLKQLIARDWLASIARPAAGGLAAILLVVAILAEGRLYTSVTFALTAAALGYHVWAKSAYLGRFFLAYVVIFAFPFLIVNGILTGSFIEEQVVWYDDTQNLGIRAGTIPIEDFVYGLLLYLMNVTLYERFLSE